MSCIFPECHYCLTGLKGHEISCPECGHTLAIVTNVNSSTLEYYYRSRLETTVRHVSLITLFPFIVLFTILLSNIGLPGELESYLFCRMFPFISLISLIALVVGFSKFSDIYYIFYNVTHSLDAHIRVSLFTIFVLIFLHSICLMLGILGLMTLPCIPLIPLMWDDLPLWQFVFLAPVSFLLIPSHLILIFLRNRWIANQDGLLVVNQDKHELQMITWLDELS